MITTGFSGLDSLRGGLRENKPYLLYGENGTGKTTFALSFLHEGLRQGEGAVLVTGRLPAAILDQAEAFGFSLRQYVQSQELVLFEYPENLGANLSCLLDDGRIMDELRSLLGGRTVRRL